MKKEISTMLFVLSAICSFAQGKPIEFKNKYPFDRFLMKKLTSGFPIIDTTSRYAEAIIDFDKSGKIVSVSVFSITDDSLGYIVKRAILSSDGMWKNNTGKQIMASQPIYLEYMRDPATNKKLTFEKYTNGKMEKVYELEPLKMQFTHQR
jgi:hypothetical protein